MRTTPAMPPVPRGLIGFIALGYTAFVIYGSLVPLKFHPIPWDDAIARFGAIPFLELGIGSRPDWVANILLFIPLAFFWLGVMWPRGFLARSLATLLVLAAGASLSVGIEFTQIFFPPRTASLNDIVAECIGTVIGVVAWWVFGVRLSRWYVDWRRIKEPATFAERLAWTYIAAIFIYGVLPLDLTISAVEIFHKWREGKLNLIPFAALPSEPGLAIYDLMMDALMWAPPAFFWRISGKRSSLRVWGMTLGGAALLEFLQLFVYSRVTDVTEVITAALGGAVGVWLGVKYVAGVRPGKEMERTTAASDILKTLLPLALAVMCVIGLAVLFWYPFNFRTDGAFLHERLHDLLTRVPFEAYYYGTEYRAATEVLHKVLFFIPLGAILAWFVSQLRWTWRGFGTLLSLVLIAFTALAIDLGRLALPEKNPDSVDIILQWLGGVMGFVIIKVILSRRLLAVKSGRTASSSNGGRHARPVKRVTQAMESPIHAIRNVRHSHEAPAPSTFSRNSMAVENSSRDLARGEYQPQASGTAFWRNTLLIYGILILVTAVLTHSPAAPYNVRELLYPSLPWLSTLLLGALPLLLWLPPVYFATRLQRGRIGLAPLYPFAHASAIWLLLTLAVPTESLDDILGSPILHWSMWLERWMRMVALFGGWSAIATCAVLPLITRAKRPWRVCGLLTLSWLVIAHWGVVTEAATDNLTELMAGGGSAFAILMLASAMGLITATSAILARTFVRQGRSEQVLGLLLLPLLILLAIGGFWLGMEHELHKYGQTFSAAQFLLSKGRDAYASGPRLALRAAIALCGVVGVGALAQWPAWRRLAANKDLVTHT